MIVPFVVYILGLVFLGFVKLLMNSAMNPFFELGLSNSVAVQFLNSVWTYLTLIWFIVGALLLFILAQKRGGGVFS